MNKTISVLSRKTPQFWIWGVMLIYGLLYSEYLHLFSEKVSPQIVSALAANSIYLYFFVFNIAITIVLSFVIWQVSSFLFHIFATLLGGEASFKDFQKYSGLLYIFPIVGIAISWFLLDGLTIPPNVFSDYIISDPAIVRIGWIINISSTSCFVLLIPVIWFLYRISWVKALGAVVIPIGSIYLLSLFFSEYVL